MARRVILAPPLLLVLVGVDQLVYSCVFSPRRHEALGLFWLVDKLPLLRASAGYRVQDQSIMITKAESNKTSHLSSAQALPTVADRECKTLTNVYFVRRVVKQVPYLVIGNLCCQSRSYRT
ncbi:hypothetical protein J3F83DRAFT_743338 [Trichoderma novae-zelandiae]